VEGFRHSSKSDREFYELRSRAYGPDPDIIVDPPALARLRELEAANRAEVNSLPVAPAGESAADSEAPADAASMEHPVPRWSRLGWVGGALVLAVGIVTTTLMLSGPRPEATLYPTRAAVDDQVRELVEGVPMLLVEASTLRGYGSYLGLEIWSGVDRFDSPCLVAIHRASGNLSKARCAPAPADLIMDVASSGDGFEGFEGRSGDGIIRFILRDDKVDAYVYLMPEEG
jgi:hypothetical protein